MTNIFSQQSCVSWDCYYVYSWVCCVSLCVLTKTEDSGVPDERLLMKAYPDKGLLMKSHPDERLLIKDYLDK